MERVRAVRASARPAGILVLREPGAGGRPDAFFPFMQIQDVSLESIDIYGGTQARAATNEEAIAAYAEEMAAGTVFPPIVVFFDGATHWLADGFHRYLAAKRNNLATIRAEVQPGGRADALKHALGANATNGVHRTNADKRNAVGIALEEWSELANPVIADLCRVSVEFVRRTRQELTKLGQIEAPERVTGRNGKDYPARIERQPRGGSGKGEKDELADGPARERGSEGSGGGAGSGGGGRPGKAKGDFGAPGGSSMELEAEARAMMRKGEANPFELRHVMSANAHDYAEAVINLLGTMKADDPKRSAGLLRIKRWVEGALAGQTLSVTADAAMGEDAVAVR